MYEELITILMISVLFGFFGGLIFGIIRRVFIGY
jgi:hypothetical protein